MTIVQFLQKCSVFQDSTPTLLADVAHKMHRETPSTGDEIIKQGDVGEKFYIIRSGNVEAVKEVDGKEELLSTLGPGDFFGELALLEKQPRVATVRAVDEVEVLTLSKDLFEQVVESSASFEDQLRKVYFAR